MPRYTHTHVHTTNSIKLQFKCFHRAHQKHRTVPPGKHETGHLLCTTYSTTDKSFFLMFDAQWRHTAETIISFDKCHSNHTEQV